MEKARYFWIDGDIGKALRSAGEWLELMQLNSDGVIAVVSQYDDDIGYTVIVVYRDKPTR